MTTQKDIARKIGIDVSSVNKILGHSKRGVFRKETIALVFKTARQMGYDFGKASKGNLVQVLRELFPKDDDAGALSVKRGITVAQVQAIRDLIQRAAGAALVLLVLKTIIGL